MESNPSTVDARVLMSYFFMLSKVQAEFKRLKSKL